MLVSNTDNHKRDCEFAEESIAYLYGELDESQKVKFSLHLENCANCAGEVNAFASIHSSIQNWKAAKFDILSTPIIEIPTDLRQKCGNEAVVSSSWLMNLREIFSFTRGWIQVGAFVALLVGLGLGLYFLNFSNREELTVEKPDNKTIINGSPAFDNEFAKADKPASNARDDNDSKKSEMKSQVDGENLPAKKAVPSKVSTNTKIPENKQKTPEKILNRETKMPKTNKNILSVKTRNFPKLNTLPEEAEDEDLRLADLFDEIDAG